MHEGSVPESHLGLRWMDIHVHLFAVAIQEQEREWVAGRRHQVVIGRQSACISTLVANETAVHEQVDRVAVQLLHLRTRNEATQGEARVPGFFPSQPRERGALVVAEVDQIIQHMGAEHLIHAVANFGDGRDAEQLDTPCRSSKLLSG